jgi:hypothetical protein
VTRSKIHRVVLGALCAFALLSTLLGTTAIATARAHQTRRHHVKRSHRSPGQHLGIPQHNGGDRDSDNNGAPSDGDGNQ